MGISVGNVPPLHDPPSNRMKPTGFCRARRADHFGIKLLGSCAPFRVAIYRIKILIFEKNAKNSISGSYCKDVFSVILGQNPKP
jgi:hypothetical protein